MTSKPNQPITTLRDGPIKAVIWKNSRQNRHYYNVQLVRIYQNATGDFLETGSFSGTDMLRLARLSTKAYDAIADLRSTDKARVASPDS